MTDQTAAPPARKQGWPKGKPRGPRAQQPLQEPTSEPARIGHNSGAFDSNGRAVATGRNGEILTRKRTVSSDIFHIPDHLIPKGYTYQWNVLEVLQQPQTAARLAMHENGWRPVPASRHAGMFMPAGYTGNEIVRDGLILEERPAILTEEAKAEEAAKANLQMRDQLAQLRLGEKLPSGFSRENAKLRSMERQQTTREYAPPPSEISRPQLQIDQS